MLSLRKYSLFLSSSRRTRGCDNRFSTLHGSVRAIPFNSPFTAIYSVNFVFASRTITEDKQLVLLGHVQLLTETRKSKHSSQWNPWRRRRKIKPRKKLKSGLDEDLWNDQREMTMIGWRKPQNVVNRSGIRDCDEIQGRLEDGLKMLAPLLEPFLLFPIIVISTITLAFNAWKNRKNCTRTACYLLVICPTKHTSPNIIQAIPQWGRPVFIWTQPMFSVKLRTKCSAITYVCSHTLFL